MTGGLLGGDVFRGLAFRVLVFLSLALLPFGLIAVVQTREIAEQAQVNTELSLIGLTEQASATERTIFQEGLGAAQALSAMVNAFGEDAETCSAFLRRYQEASKRYSLVGFLPPNGVMQCASADVNYDFSDFEGFADSVAAPRRNITRVEDGAISGQPVLVLTQPFEDADDAFLGFITLSIPVDTLGQMDNPPARRQPTDLITFNADGEILTSVQPIKVTQGYLPENRSLKALVGERAAVFEEVNDAGDDLVYAVAPIVPGVVYAMSVWSQTDVLANVSQRGTLSTFLPILMWVASLVVAFWAINRLAIRNIQKLGRQMRLFAYNRAIPRSAMGPGVPREFIDIQQAFRGMADSIIHDEASLEDSLREKNILLKEVHHRVKNNLQLISSIMNMQIRRAPNEDARRVLRRLQERILSLATVHKNLYQSEGLERVNAGALIEEIIGQLLVVGLPAGSAVQVEQSYAPVQMDTDDAAPLTLLVSEAVTNAMKYIGHATPQKPAHLSITLRQKGEETAEFMVRNTVGETDGVEGTGLGTQLINAFARQLNGTVSAGVEEDLHILTLEFPLPHRIKPVQDY